MNHKFLSFIIFWIVTAILTAPCISLGTGKTLPSMSAFRMGMSKQEVSAILNQKFNYKSLQAREAPKLFPTHENPYGTLPGSAMFTPPKMPGQESLSVESRESVYAPRNMWFIFADDKLIQTKVWHNGVSTFAVRDTLQKTYGGETFTVGKGVSKRTYYSATTPEFRILLDVTQNTKNPFVLYFSLDSDSIVNNLILRGKY